MPGEQQDQYSSFAASSEQSPRSQWSESSPLVRRRQSSAARRSVRDSLRASGTRRSTMLSQTSGAMADRAFLLPAGGIGASVFNLCSATLGAGVLALPRCGSLSGAFLVSLFVFLSGLASAYAIVVLVMVSARTGWMSYEEMSLKILGSKKWVYLSVLLIALLCFGTAVGYVIAIGDILDPFRKLGNSPHFLKSDHGRIFTQVAWWLVFYLPASLQKHVNSLRFASMIGVFAIAFLIILLAVKVGTEDDRPEVKIAKGGANTLFSLPVIMFGYGCQVNTFEIYSEMHNPSTKRMSITASIAVFICSAFYILAGTIGYAAFGNNVESNVLKNLDPTTGSVQSVLAAIAFVGVSVTVTMAFPLCVFPTRDAIAFLIWPPHDKDIAEEVGDIPGQLNQSQASTTASSAAVAAPDTKLVEAGGAEDEEGHGGEHGGGGQITEPKRIALVTVICLAILLSGLFIPNITTVFGIIGGLCIGAIGYSIPAMFALRSGEWTRESVGLGHVVAVWVLFFYGIVCAIVGTGISIYHIATS